jgi:hypothetical protein
LLNSKFGKANKNLSIRYRERFAKVVESAELEQIHPQDFSWRFWPVVPIYPYGKRRTIRKEVIKDTIWTFDQLQGIFYVVVPIRMTVVKLQKGGLLVYAPVAPQVYYFANNLRYRT